MSNAPPKTAALALAAALGFVTPAPAAAQPQRTDATRESRELFEKARVLAEAGRWAEACPYLKAAHELNATGGTAFQLGSCYEKTGRPDQAIPLYRFIVDRRDAMPAERVSAAESRLRELDKPAEQPEAQSVEPAPVAPSPPRKETPAPVPPAPPSRTPAIVALAAGGAAVAVGGVFGVITLSKTGDLRDRCGGTACPARFVGDQESARTTAWVSNVGIGVGIAAVVVGTVLWFTATPPKASAAARSRRSLVRASARGVAVGF